jgi:hypothetical protein
MRARIRRISLRLDLMSEAMPCAPPEGWWIMIRALVKAHAHARLARRKQEAAHRRGLTDAHGADLGADILHGVMDRHARRHHAAGRVDVHRDVLLRIFRFEEQQLGRDERGHIVLDLPGHEDDPFTQQARKMSKLRSPGTSALVMCSGII